ncbi:MAG TPA: YbjQ family protein [Cellvibrio sp.]|nr:YbjQ family protein [Cellvibrio sp.]
MEIFLAQFIGPLVIALVLLTVGFFSGRYLEKKHYTSIIARETSPDQVMVFAERLPPPVLPAPVTQLVSGSVVISSDYFKRFIAGLRMLIGGRLNTYESLLDRARREAILRMREEAKALGATQIFNVKLETMSIGGRNPNSVSCLEVLAYGTAIIPHS